MSAQTSTLGDKFIDCTCGGAIPIELLTRSTRCPFCEEEIGVPAFLMLLEQREELLREIALAEAYTESLQRQLIAAGVLDPEVRP